MVRKRKQALCSLCCTLQHISALCYTCQNVKPKSHRRLSDKAIDTRGPSPGRVLSGQLGGATRKSTANMHSANKAGRGSTNIVPATINPWQVNAKGCLLRREVCRKTLAFKNWPIFYVHVDMWWICPMWAKCTFGDQKGLTWKKDMLFYNFPFHGTKSCRLFKKMAIFSFVVGRKVVFWGSKKVFWGALGV